MMFKKEASTAKSRLSVLTLKNRLRIGFVALMTLAVCVFALVMNEDHRIAGESAEIALRAHQESANAIHLQEVLTEIEKMARSGEISDRDIMHFRRLLDRLDATETLAEGKSMLRVLRSRFELYVKSLSAPPVNASRARYEEVAASAGALTELHLNSIFQMADQIRLRQDHTLHTVLWVLVAVLTTLGIGGSLVISIITKPLSVLAQFLNDFDIEADLPAEIPSFQSNVPEVRQVAHGFGQVLERLRGYRALNVKRLLFEKRRADLMVASISDGIFLLKGDEVVYLNPVAEKIMGGMNAAQLRGGLGALVARTETSKQTQRASRAVMSAVFQTMPIELAVEVDQRTNYYLIHASPISFDVLEQNQAQGRIAGIQPDVLVVARDMTLVRESQEAKGHFLATLSHEVKTPVTSLTLATRMLKKTTEQTVGLTATQRSLIATCVEDVDRLRGLLENLLTVSRFDILTQKMEFQAADLAKLIRHSVQSFKEQAFERGVEIAIRFAAGTRKGLQMSMDPAKIAWALSNLLTNALRHTPRGGSVEVQLDVSQEDWVEVKVVDNGPGIDKKRQDRIFDRFNSYYDIRIARSGGAGVGLAIAREIVHAHGGRIWVVSEAGQGAQFCFTLPLKGRAGHAAQSESSVGGGNIMTLKGAGSGASARS